MQQIFTLVPMLNPSLGFVTARGGNLEHRNTNNSNNNNNNNSKKQRRNLDSGAFRPRVIISKSRWADKLRDNRKIVFGGKNSQCRCKQERALKQLYCGKDVPAVLSPGFGKDRINQAPARPTRWHNCNCLPLLL